MATGYHYDSKPSTNTNFLTMRRLSLLLSVLAFVFLAGCTSVGGYTSSNHIEGCDQADITIADYKSTWTGDTWTATCGGKSYSCKKFGSALFQSCEEME